MKLLKVYYSKEGLSGDPKDIITDVEKFPLKPRKYRLKKHPSFVFSIFDYSNNTLTFGFKKKKITLKDGNYTYCHLKKTAHYKHTVFFEMIEEKVESEILDS